MRWRAAWTASMVCIYTGRAGSRRRASTRRTTGWTSSSRRRSRKAGDEVHDLILRPVAVVLGGRGGSDEPAVSAVRAQPQVDVAVGRDLGVVKRLRRNERVGLGRDDERGHTNAVDDTHRARPVVVIFGVAKAEMRRRIGLVELTHGLHAVER